MPHTTEHQPSDFLLRFSDATHHVAGRLVVLPMPDKTHGFAQSFNIRLCQFRIESGNIARDDLLQDMFNELVLEDRTRAQTGIIHLRYGTENACARAGASREQSR